jgi:ABC-2 type transport system permease protein
MTLPTIISTELLKLKRSRITWLSMLGFALIPLVGTLFMAILKDPALGRKLGLLATKARWTAGSADWPTYFSMIQQGAGVAGMILVGIITSYVFGREYNEGTAKNLLAIPVRRSWFVVGKIVVVSIWLACISLVFLLEAFVLGGVLGLPLYSPDLAVHCVETVLTTIGLALLLGPAFGWIAVASKGYLAPIGATIVAMLLGTIFGTTGWGKWFPWSIVPILGGAAGADAAKELGAGSFIVVVVVFVAGTISAMIQIEKADNTQ